MTERKASMGDKVYRGDVVKFIRNNISLGTFMKRTIKTADEACWDLCDKLNYVPAIEEKPEPHWIPVTERLPEKSGEYLVTVKWVTGESDVDVYEYDAKHKTWNDGESAGGERAVAWCNLPEPYKGVTE